MAAGPGIINPCHSPSEHLSPTSLLFLPVAGAGPQPLSTNRIQPPSYLQGTPAVPEVGKGMQSYNHALKGEGRKVGGPRQKDHIMFKASLIT